MVPPSLSFHTHDFMLRRGTYFQATSAILRFPRGPTKWEGAEGRRREWRGDALLLGLRWEMYL